MAATLYYDGADQLIDLSPTTGDATTPCNGGRPLGRYRSFGDRWVVFHGDDRWHPPAREGEFGYVENELDEITDDDVDSTSFLP